MSLSNSSAFFFTKYRLRRKLSGGEKNNSLLDSKYARLQDGMRGKKEREKEKKKGEEKKEKKIGKKKRKKERCFFAALQQEKYLCTNKNKREIRKETDRSKETHKKKKRVTAAKKIKNKK